MSASAPAVTTDLPVAAREKKGKRRLVVIGLAFVATVGGYGGYRALVADDQSTDDAVVDADVVPVSLRVGGQVASIAVAGALS